MFCYAMVFIRDSVQALLAGMRRLFTGQTASTPWRALCSPEC
jgi:hypothetical protein